MSCNTVEKSDPSLVTELRDSTKDIMKTLDKLEICHGRDVAFTGYLFGQPPIAGKSKPYQMAGVAQTFAGGSKGVGGYAERNTFGWCATLGADLCAGYKIPSATNATSTSNMTETAK